MPSVGERIRRMCEELGPYLCKARADSFHAHGYRHGKRGKAAAKLQDSVAPFSYEEARDVIETELGDTIGHLFAEFDATPVASASVSQVYRAKLFSGPEVAVKVQRPHIRENIETDLGIWKGLRDLWTNIPNTANCMIFPAWSQSSAV